MMRQRERGSHGIPPPPSPLPPMRRAPCMPCLASRPQPFPPSRATWSSARHCWLRRTSWRCRAPSSRRQALCASSSARPWMCSQPRLTASQPSVGGTTWGGRAAHRVVGVGVGGVCSEQRAACRSVTQDCVRGRWGVPAPNTFARAREIPRVSDHMPVRLSCLTLKLGAGHAGSRKHAGAERVGTAVQQHAAFAVLPRGGLEAASKNGEMYRGRVKSGPPHRPQWPCCYATGGGGGRRGSQSLAV